MNPLQERFEPDPEGLVIVGASQPAFRTKLHILYAANGTGQPRQFIRWLADVLADQRLQNCRQVQLLLRDQLLLLGTGLAEVQLLLLTAHDIRQVYRGRVGATLTPSR